MKGRFSVVGARQLLSAMLTPDVYVAPETLYLALCGKLPVDGDPGNALLEPPVSSGYARAEIPLGSAWWTSSGYGTFWNAIEVIFPPAQVTWQRTRAYAITTAPTSGEVWAMGLTSMGNVPAGNQLVVAPGEIQLMLRGSAL